MNKEDLLRKLKALASDERGNENERKLAEERLNYLIKKYDIDPKSIDIDNLVRREFYFKEEWEWKLICQTIYKLFPEKQIRKYKNKRNWIFVEMTDYEYLEFEMHYCAYKSTFERELELFYTAFISKNHIYPDEPPENDKAAKPSLSREERMKIAMMAQGIEQAQVRRLLNE